MMTSTRRKAVALAIASALARASATAANGRNLIHQASTYGFKQTSDEDNTHDVSIVFGKDENGDATTSFVIEEEPDQMWEDVEDGSESEEKCGEQCVDNPDFVSMMGLPCHGHSYFECGMFVQVGFTEEEVKELISNCPCSCQACPTPEPSSNPTLAPTTSRPSAAPVSSAPTSRPSAAPVITSSPTTKSPTTAPTTLSPSKTPTFRPSRTPTLQPSTSSPTNSPTQTPTSTAPTSSSPVQTMSATTRIQPINASGETACPTGYSGLIGTIDCKGAIHCADGVKSFGPIPCLSGPQGDLLFDIKSQKCVIPSNEYVCQQLPNEEDNGEEEVDIFPSESKESAENHNDADEPQADQTPGSQTQTKSPANIQTPPPNTPGEIEVTERISFPKVAEDDASDDMENNVLGPLSLKELIIISAGGGCLVLFIGMSVFFAARRKRSAEEKKSQNNQDEKQHNAGKSSSSTIDTDDATPTVEYYTYINKAMRNNRAVTNFSTSKQAWSTKREFLAEKRSQKSSSTASEESSRQREDDTIDAQENGTVTDSMRGDNGTVGADATVVSEDEGATEIAYSGSKAGKSFASAFGW